MTESRHWLITGGAEIDPGGGCQPLGAPPMSAQLPAAPGVEVGDEAEEALGVGLEAVRRGDDLLAQGVEGVELLDGEVPDVGGGGSLGGRALRRWEN